MSFELSSMFCISVASCKCCRMITSALKHIYPSIISRFRLGNLSFGILSVRRQKQAKVKHETCRTLNKNPYKRHLVFERLWLNCSIEEEMFMELPNLGQARHIFRNFKFKILSCMLYPKRSQLDVSTYWMWHQTSPLFPSDDPKFPPSFTSDKYQIPTISDLRFCN